MPTHIAVQPIKRLTSLSVANRLAIVYDNQHMRGILMGPSVRDILSIKHTNATCQVTGTNNILSSVSTYKIRHA